LELGLPTKQPSSKKQKYVNYKLVSKRLANINRKQLITNDSNDSDPELKS
jgi:hypothetical protein